MFKSFMRGIKVIRVHRGMSKKELADRAGLSEAVYSRLETPSQSSNPRLDTLMKLSRAVNMDIEGVLEFDSIVEKAINRIDNRA